MATSDIRPVITEDPNAPDLYVDQFWFETKQIGAMPLAVAANLGEVISKQRAIRAPQPPKGTKH
jgi:hypothetical protein